MFKQRRIPGIKRIQQGTALHPDIDSMVQWYMQKFDAARSCVIANILEYHRDLLHKRAKSGRVYTTRYSRQSARRLKQKIQGKPIKES